MSIWNPWRGCHKKSEGCKHCYIFGGNARKGIDTNIVYKTDEFYRPVARDAKGNYRMKPGQTVYVCFNADFFVEEADAWRPEAWDMIRERQDLHFLFLTKRIERYREGLPEDFGENFNHVTICATVENQRRADERVPILKSLPIKHKMITMQPMLEPIDLSAYLDEHIERVIVGGESGWGVRPLYYDWVLDIRRQCMAANVSFDFRQLGSVFIKDGVTYHVKTQQLGAQARKAGIDFTRQ